MHLIIGNEISLLKEKELNTILTEKLEPGNYEIFIVENPFIKKPIIYEVDKQAAMNLLKGNILKISI